MRPPLALGLLLVAAASACRVGEPTSLLPPISKQIEVREGWIAERHELLLGMMRRCAVDMFVLVTEGFHPDPLAEILVTPRPLVGDREFFVFIDGGREGLQRVALSWYDEENVTRLFPATRNPREAKDVLAELVLRWKPATIALSCGGRHGVSRSLTHDAYQLIAEALGPQAMTRVVPAEPLLEELLDTRLPNERPYFAALLQLTDALARRALSAEVITPSLTTVGDIRRWLIDEVEAHHAAVWFQPDLRVQRHGTALAEGDFPAVAAEAVVIERGDLLHLDLGLVAMGLSTDWQKMAYVLRPGESEPPAGMRLGLANTNVLQRALCAAARPGRAAGEVHDAAMAEMTARGITAMIYSHALGTHGHALGPTIDFRSARRGDTARLAARLRAGSYLAVELSTRLAVEEWGGQEVFFGEEDPAWLAEDGYCFFRPIQDSFYLIR